MFDFLKNNTEEKKMQAAEEKAQQFTNDQNLIQGAMRPDTYYNDANDGRNDLIKWQQDFDEDIDMLRHDFLKEVLTEKGWRPELICVGYNEKGEQVLEAQKPLVNVQGTYKLISLVKRYINRNFMMSNFDEATILLILRRLNENITANVFPKWEEYEIEPADLQLITKMVLDSIHATLLRALNDGERRHIRTQNKRVEAFTETSQPQGKKGLLGALD